MKAIEQYFHLYFPMVLFIMLYKVIPTSSVDEFLPCYHLKERFLAVFSCFVCF